MALSIASTTASAQIEQVLKMIRTPKNPLSKCTYVTTKHFDCLLDSTDISLFFRRDFSNPMLVQKISIHPSYITNGDELQKQCVRKICQSLQELIDQGLLSKERLRLLSDKRTSRNNICNLVILPDEDGVVRYVYFVAFYYSGEFFTDEEMKLIYDKLIGMKMDFSSLKKPVMIYRSEAGKSYKFEYNKFFVELAVNIPNPASLKF